MEGERGLGEGGAAAFRFAIGQGVDDFNSHWVLEPGATVSDSMSPWL